MSGLGPLSRRWLRTGGVLLAVLLLGGWSGTVCRDVAWRAVDFFPGDLAEQVRLNHKRYDAGIRRGLELPPAWRVGSPGHLREALRHQALVCHDGLRKPEPLADLVEQLGTLAVLVCDANDPLAVADSDPREPRYAMGWLRYGESVRGRVRIVYYGQEPVLLDQGDLDAFIGQVLARSRELYPFVGDEFFRTGTLRSWTAIDDRSVAFGVAGISLSHAMTDLANLATWIWVEGGGARPTPLPTPVGHKGPTVTVILGGGLPDRDRPKAGQPALPPAHLRIPR